MPRTRNQSRRTSTTQDHDETEAELYLTQKKFNKACEHLLMLDRHIKRLEHRYNEAVRNQRNAFRYNLRLRLSVFTGVKMMFYEYASKLADTVNTLRTQVYGAWADEDDEDNDSNNDSDSSEDSTSSMDTD